jgi:hypothetical protein
MMVPNPSALVSRFDLDNDKLESPGISRFSASALGCRGLSREGNGWGESSSQMKGNHLIVSLSRGLIWLGFQLFSVDRRVSEFPLLFSGSRSPSRE